MITLTLTDEEVASLMEMAETFVKVHGLKAVPAAHRWLGKIQEAKIPNDGNEGGEG